MTYSAAWHSPKLVLHHVAGGYFVNVEGCPRRAERRSWGLACCVEVKGEDLGGRSCKSRDCEELM